MISKDDFNEQIEELKRLYNHVLAINNSLSEQREEYRKFADSLSIEYEALENACKSFERRLLIACYTISEKMLKSFIYSILDKDKHKNFVLNKFINTKLPPKKYSPKVKIEEIQEQLKNNFFDNFSFCLLNDDKKKSYNEMINNRHEYAHMGYYAFNAEKFKDVLEVLEVLNFTYQYIIKQGIEKWNNFLILINNIKDSLKLVISHKDNRSLENKKLAENIKKAKKVLIIFLNCSQIKRISINSKFKDINTMLISLKNSETSDEFMDNSLNVFYELF